MRTTASRFQAETTCQGTSQKGPLSLSNDPTRGTSSSIQSDRVRAGGWGTATTKSGGSVRTRQCCLCRPRRYSEPRPADKSALDHRRKAGPSGLSPTAEAWGGPQGKEGRRPHSALSTEAGSHPGASVLWRSPHLRPRFTSGAVRTIRRTNAQEVLLREEPEPLKGRSREEPAARHGGLACTAPQVTQTAPDLLQNRGAKTLLPGL